MLEEGCVRSMTQKGHETMMRYPLGMIYVSISCLLCWAVLLLLLPKSCDILWSRVALSVRKPGSWACHYQQHKRKTVF